MAAEFTSLYVIETKRKQVYGIIEQSRGEAAFACVYNRVVITHDAG